MRMEGIAGIYDKPYLFLDLVELDCLAQDVLIVLDPLFLFLMELNEVLQLLVLLFHRGSFAI